MIRGTTAQFKIEMPKDINDFCVIEVIFGQEGNVGTIEAPLPIKKTYNRGYVKVQYWNPVGKNTNNIYYDGTNYYIFENNQWVSNTHVDIFDTNHGTKIDENNPKVLLVNLNPLETMRFSDKRKGFVQAFGYCDGDDILIGCDTKQFMIYPVRNDTSKLLPTNPSLIIVDAGMIL